MTPLPRSRTYNDDMKMTRRTLTRVVAGAAVLSSGATAQAPPAPPASASDAEVNAARAGFREAARELGTVKLPRATEPATRFEV
jgi:hypothetical protein